MKIQEKKLKRKNIKTKDISGNKHSLLSPIHVFKQSNLTMSIGIAKKAQKIFSLKA